MKNDRPKQIIDSTFRHLDRMLAEKNDVKSNKVKERKKSGEKSMAEVKKEVKGPAGFDAVFEPNDILSGL